MKKTYVISILCALLFLFMTGSALAQPLTPAECAVAEDPANCCDYTADEATRVETARMILKVHARTVGGVPEDESHYYNSINGWAVNGSGEDLYSSDDIPAVYQESSLSNLTRQEMWDYLVKIFEWQSDMELVIYDEVWETHPDDSMTYMLLNKWFGSTEAGYSEQPGISIVKFRPGEGCASYQRDFFTEGDLYWGMDFSHQMVIDKRNTVITELGLTDKCVDEDGDGYTKYAAATGCANGDVVDCDDFDADIHPVDNDGDGYYAVDGGCPGDDCNDDIAAINPGAAEIMGDGIDSNCKGGDNCATFPVTPESPLDLLPFFALFLVPAVYGYVLKRRLARNRIQ